MEYTTLYNEFQSLISDEVISKDEAIRLLLNYISDNDLESIILENFRGDEILED